jgi:hypothetical protein
MIIGGVSTSDYGVLHSGRAKRLFFALREARILAYVFRYGDPRVTIGFWGTVERAAKADKASTSATDWM